MTHNLKVWPEFFNLLGSDEKNFEIRKRDREFSVGDTLVLSEWSPTSKEFTGESRTAEVIYLLNLADVPGILAAQGSDSPNRISDFCVMGLNFLDEG